ncbi:unnamed protein product [Lactuca saligna]|uniref:Uncharacterized protein n=1 Tax=Lactuca saligna TaxID=75948 RepID=A0AA35YCV7_LACSI|nr:unnamed protein product [Lactuca saligna]
MCFVMCLLSVNFLRAIVYLLPQGPNAPVKLPTKRKVKDAPSEADSKKQKVKQAARKRKYLTLTPSESDHSQSDTLLDVRNKEEQPIDNEEDEQVHNEEATSNPEVTPT